MGEIKSFSVLSGLTFLNPKPDKPTVCPAHNSQEGSKEVKMWQHVGSHIHAASFFSTTPTTTNSTTFSLCCFPFPSTASPSSISISRSSCPSSMPEAVPLNQEEEEDPVSFIHLQSICSEDHFDRVVAEAHQRNDPLLLVWMASWCRKGIYLKPKLEKLAVDFYPRLQFYSVDVNAVSHKLVARAGVTKMPTIQLWKDSMKKAEVISGHSHKAYLVINEVQEMIENECTM